MVCDLQFTPLQTLNVMLLHSAQRVLHLSPGTLLSPDIFGREMQADIVSNAAECKQQIEGSTSRAFSGLLATACVDALNAPPLLGSNLTPASSKSFAGAAHVHTMWVSLMGRIRPSLHTIMFIEHKFCGQWAEGLLSRHCMVLVCSGMQDIVSGHTVSNVQRLGEPHFSPPKNHCGFSCTLSTLSRALQKTVPCTAPEHCASCACHQITTMLSISAATHRHTRLQCISCRGQPVRMLCTGTIAVPNLLQSQAAHLPSTAASQPRNSRLPPQATCSALAWAPLPQCR